MLPVLLILLVPAVPIPQWNMLKELYNFHTVPSEMQCCTTTTKSVNINFSLTVYRNTTLHWCSTLPNVHTQRAYPVTPCNTTMTSQHTDGTASFSSWPNIYIDSTLIYWCHAAPQWRHWRHAVTFSSWTEMFTKKRWSSASYSTTMTSLTFQWRYSVPISNMYNDKTLIHWRRVAPQWRH